MTWPFEHWDNGKVYLHNENWLNFRKDIDRNGYKDEKHDWLHHRILCRLHTPRQTILDIPVRGDEDLKYKIESNTTWTTIYEPFPAFERTAHDPEGWLPSWNLYAENNHAVGEEIIILQTGEIFDNTSGSFLRIRFSSNKNTFAYFREKYWIVSEYYDYGIGAAAPPKKVKPKKVAARSIFEPFEEGW